MRKFTSFINNKSRVRAMEKRSISVLVIDPSTINAYLTRKFLEREGLNVHTVSNTENAIYTIVNQEFDAIVVDLIMPKVNGFEIVEFIRSQEATRHLPVFMVSTLKSKEIELKSKQLKCNGYYLKPFNYTKLVTDIHTTVVRNSEMHCPFYGLSV